MPQYLFENQREEIQELPQNHQLNQQQKAVGFVWEMGMILRLSFNMINGTLFVSVLRCERTDIV